MPWGMGQSSRAGHRGEVKVVLTGKAKGADAKGPTTITRPRLRRLMLLHERLTEQFQADPPPSRYLNATSIARELDYERRTIKRDIEILQDEWKFPIEYSRKHHGYYYTREVKKFPTLHITTGQVMAVTLACQFIRANRNTPFAEPMLETLQSLEETFCDEQISIDFQALCERIRFFPSFEAIFDVEIFEVFRSAAQEQHWLTFYHRKPDPEAKAEKRRLAVLTLQLINGGWYAVGFDEERQAIRQFLLARVSEVAVEKTKFQRDKYEALLKKYQQRTGMGPFGNQNPERIRIRFDREVAAFVQERDWHPSQAFRTLKNGKLEMTLEMEPNIDLQRWLAGWLGQFEVLEPVALREKVAEIGARMVERHAGG